MSGAAPGARHEGDWLDARIRALGFAAWGVTPAAPSTRAAELRAWLDAGRHGEMSYLADRVEQLVDPGAFVTGARSIVCVADRYHDGAADPFEAGSAPRRLGRIARYARGTDYHRVIRRRLHALCDELRTRWPAGTFRACVDTAPLLEREHAARAGLGAIGKHTLLIEAEGGGRGTGAGSWLLLGAIVTDVALPATRIDPDASLDPCGTCTRCIDACPTHAIEPWHVDATRCISYLTIEHRSEIDPGLELAMGDWIFGCDVCQDVCPHNQPTDRARRSVVDAAYQPRRTGFDLVEVLGWTEDDRRAAFTTSAMKRSKLGMMKRNAAIAAGNRLRAGIEDDELRAALERLAADEGEDAVARAAARRALVG